MQDVLFIPLSIDEPLKIIQRKIQKIYQLTGVNSRIEKNDFVAIKIHFGEKGNKTHIPATYLAPLSKAVEEAGGIPFVTDTNVLYKSARSNAVSHLKLAQGHGFTVANCGAPVIITDGLRGSNEVEVGIDGEIFDRVSIATEAVTSNAMIVMTHVTGHIETGMGGALKNLGMGLASRKGKLRQHSSVKPWVEEENCTQCGLCIEWCPEDAIEMMETSALIHDDKCIGCGECLTVCRFSAVKFNWKTSGAELQKKIAEHALGAVQNKRDKTAYLNFLINITKDCDCFGRAQDPVIPDIGILAGTDPVAVDQASLDMIQQRSNRSMADLSYPDTDATVQLQHAEKIALGERRYQLKEIDLS